MVTDARDNPLFQLDAVLIFLYHDVGRIFSAKQITKMVIGEVNVTENEVILIVQKLFDDGYIDKHVMNDPDDNRLVPNQINGYTITFNGRVFVKQGGYNLQEIYLRQRNDRVEKLESDQMAIQKNMQTLTALIAVATVVASVYYLMEIYKELHLFSHRHGVYWIWETLPSKK